jgi:hypothetical protein
LGGWIPVSNGAQAAYGTGSYNYGTPVTSIGDKTANGSIGNAALQPLSQGATLTELRYIAPPTGAPATISATGFIKMPNNVPTAGPCWHNYWSTATDDCLSANTSDQLVYTNPAGTYIIPLAAPLSGTTSSIGGSALTAGTCASGTVNVTGSTTAMAVSASPVTYPGDAFVWKAYVSSAGIVTVKVCTNLAAGGTPTASVYNVRVIQ